MVNRLFWLVEAEHVFCAYLLFIKQLVVAHYHSPQPQLFFSLNHQVEDSSLSHVFLFAVFNYDVFLFAFNYDASLFDLFRSDVFLIEVSDVYSDAFLIEVYHSIALSDAWTIVFCHFNVFLVTGVSEGYQLLIQRQLVSHVELWQSERVEVYKVLKRFYSKERIVPHNVVLSSQSQTFYRFPFADREDLKI